MTKLPLSLDTVSGHSQALLMTLCNVMTSEANLISAKRANRFLDGRQLTLPVVDAKKLFWRKSRKSRFPPKLKQQEQVILKAINSVGV